MADFTPHQGPFQLDPSLSGRINSVKEAIWFRIGAMQSAMNDRERALDAFERVLAVNPRNVRAMTQAGAVLAKKECYPQAVSYLQRAITEESNCGEAWAVLAHCYVMTDDLQKAYQAYQNALSHLPNPRDPNLWYGIGLLYDRYGSLDNALEAFLAVLSISPEFERADEVCFCIGIIYKEQQNFDDALKYFNKVVVAANPPPPLTRADGWYQIGHVHELKRDITVALEMYKHALAENPKHPKTLQNFGWLEHQHNSNSSEAIRLLKHSAELDPSDGQTWYLLGRVYMALREFRQAYDAYQQAVYRDGRNATFWCSIGVLYYQMNQYRDAMDAYSRAIRLNPYVSEVWYDLGTLYESCGQSHDAIDAYRKAADLAPDNTQITARLSVLESSVNPGAHPQSQAQPHSGPQSQPQPLPPQQMQPDMSQGNQGHGHAGLNSLPGRPVAPPLQQPPPPLGQDKLPSHTALPSTKLQPPPQDLAHSGPGSQPGASQTLAALSHRSTHMELAHIPAINTHGVPHARPLGANGNFLPETRGSSLPAGSQTLGHQGPDAVPAMIPQQLHALPTSGIAPKHQDAVTNFAHRSAPLASAQLPSQSTHQGPQDRHNPQLPHVAPPQTGHKLPTHLPQLPPPSQQASMLASQNAHNGPDQTQLKQVSQPLNHTASHVAPREPQSIQDSQSLRPSHQSQQKSPHSQVQGQAQQHGSSEPLPGIHPLPMPQVHQADSELQKRQNPQSRTSSGPLDPQRMSHPHDADANRTQYLQPQVDVLRRSRFDRPGDRHELNLQKGSKPDGDPVPVPPFSTGMPEAAGVSQPRYPSNRNTVQGLPSSGNRIPALREPMVEQANSQLPPRSMSMRDITQSDSRVATRPLEQMNQNVREQNDLSRSESHPENAPPVDKPAISDRLPGMGALAGPSQAKDVREDARLLTSVATPSLAIPPKRGIPSMVSKEVPKPGTSPLVPPSAAGTSSALGTGTPSLPPLSGRNPSPLGGSNQEGKETSGANIGASSLTQFGKGFGRTPVTPVSNSVAPPSLPSPLSARKSAAGSVLHIARSPRITKNSSAANYKCVPIPPSSSQIESVPSPSSLPVLPALPSHPNNDTQSSPRQKNSDHDSAREGNEAAADSRVGGSKADDKATKSNSNPGKGDEMMMNKSLFAGLRSAPAPTQQADSERQEKEDGSKPPMAPSLRHEVENPSTLKRDVPTKDDLGRTAKRPRLHDLGETGGEKYGYEADDKHKKFGDKVDLDRNDDDGRKPPILGSSKGEIASYKDIKAELRASNGVQGGDSENNQKRDGVARPSDGDVGKPLPMGGQVIDLPRLSTPMSKLGAPPQLSGNTPLPSFRTERMNLSASRGGSGSLPGKATSQDNVSRTSLPFPLRSAPVSSLSAPLKSHAPSPNRGAGDVGDNGVGDDSAMKRLADGKREGSPRAGVNSRSNVMADRVANGDVQKVSGGSGKHDTPGASDLNSKDEKQAGRPEIHTSAT